MLESIKTYYQEKPLAFALWIGLVLRLLAAVFAPGYMMHDDHFLTIEPGAGWAEGNDYVNWFKFKNPFITEGVKDHGAISFTYPGILAGIIWVFNHLGIDDPKIQMFLIRVIHAFYSLLIIVLGFKITKLLSDKRTAGKVALFLAVLFFLPNFSVRNLVEIVCIPLVMTSFYLLLKHVDRMKFVAIAGVLGGLAVGFRYQVGLLVMLAGFVLLFQKKPKAFFMYGIMSVIGFSLSQISDLILFSEPFTQIRRYADYNSKHALEYLTLPWYTYIGTILLFMVPPVSLYLVFGFFRDWKKHALIFIPVLGFFIFHSIYPNKQERFILPILPFIIILGMIGWDKWIKTSQWWIKRPKLERGGWKAFWVLNTIGLIILTFSYGKKARVEAMYYLYEQGDMQCFVQEQTHPDAGTQVPVYYCGKWVRYYVIDQDHDYAEAIDYIRKHPRTEAPNYVLFYGSEDIDARVEKFKKEFPSLSLATTIEGSWFDKLLHAVNPINKLEKVYIYRVDID